MSHLRFYRSILSRNFITRQRCSMQLCVVHKQAVTKLIGQFLFMRQSRRVRHAQLPAATLSLEKVARQNHAIKSLVWHRANAGAALQGSLGLHQRCWSFAPTPRTPLVLSLYLLAFFYTLFSQRVRYMLSQFRLSVCRVSVCDVGATYSAGWTFRQFYSPYDSPGTLVFWC